MLVPINHLSIMKTCSGHSTEQTAKWRPIIRICGVYIGEY